MSYIRSLQRKNKIGFLICGMILQIFFTFFGMFLIPTHQELRCSRTEGMCKISDGHFIPIPSLTTTYFPIKSLEKIEILKNEVTVRRGSPDQDKKYNYAASLSFHNLEFPTHTFFEMSKEEEAEKMAEKINLFMKPEVNTQNQDKNFSIQFD